MGELTEKVKEDIEERVDDSIEEGDVIEYMSEWPTLSCGFDEIGGEAFTERLTHVINHDKMWFVYHANRFAYSITNPTEKFFDDLENEELVGQKEFKENPDIYEQE
jgi:hypothetical protein